MGEILNYQRSDKYIVKSQAYEPYYETPVLTAGGSFILGYINENEGIYPASRKSPVMIFDDFTTSFHWVNFPFKVKSSAMKILTPRDGICFRYVFYAMQCIFYRPRTHARQWIATYSKFKIPLPSLAEQKRIVDILDKFSAYCEDISRGLPAEIAARQKQYAYYRNKLLSFSA